MDRIPERWLGEAQARESSVWSSHGTTTDRAVLTSKLSCGIEADCQHSSPLDKEPVLGPAHLPEKGAPSPMPRVTPQRNQTGLRALPATTVTVPGRTGRVTGLRLQPDAKGSREVPPAHPELPSGKEN